MAIDSQEVQEGNGALQRGLGNQGNFFACLEESAGHVRVDNELDFRHVDDMVPHLDILVLNTLHKFRLVLIAGKLTPKLLQVDATDGHVASEHAIDLLERMLHDLHLVASTALRLRAIDIWTHFIQYRHVENI